MRIAIFAALSTLLLAGTAQADCLGDLKDIVTRSMNSGPYEMTVDTAEMKMTSNFVPPGNFHSIVETEGVSQEMIISNGKAWNNMGGQGWVALPDSVAAQVSDSVLNIDTIVGGIQSPECLGNQNVDGRDLATYKYQMSMMGVDSQTTLYVDSATGLPAKMESTSTIGGQTTETKAVYRFDPSITISPPAM